MPESLKDLSERAQAGIWYTVDTPWGNGDWIVAGNPDPHAGQFVCLFDGSLIGAEADGSFHADPAENAAFVADLVNTYRSGRLHDDTALTTAVARARREALEEARACIPFDVGEYSEYGAGLSAAINEMETALDMLLARAITPPEARQTETGWKPISEAPKDSTSVIVAVPSLHAGQPMIVGEAFFDPEHDGWWWAGQSWGDYHASPIADTNAPPALWQPLPAPPPPAIVNLDREGRS